MHQEDRKGFSTHIVRFSGDKRVDPSRSKNDFREQLGVIDRLWCLLWLGGGAGALSTRAGACVV